MGFIDFFRNKRRTENKAYGGVTYEIPKPISNAEYQNKRQKEIACLEGKYDLTTVEGINAIPVPKRKSISTGGSITGRVEYYLMLKAGQYEKEGDTEKALACYRKTNELMPMSPVSYQYESYMRLPRYLRKLRRFDEARAEETKINALFPDKGVYEMSKTSFIDDMRSAGHSEQRAEELYKKYKAECDAERNKHLCRIDYEWLWEFMPDVCPKSFSGYMRMRNANTDKYRRIVQSAYGLGYKLK